MGERSKDTRERERERESREEAQGISAHTYNTLLSHLLCPSSLENLHMSLLCNILMWYWRIRKFISLHFLLLQYHMIMYVCMYDVTWTWLAMRWVREREREVLLGIFSSSNFGGKKGGKKEESSYEPSAQLSL
jgi:hypothetical protein